MYSLLTPRRLQAKEQNSYKRSKDDISVLQGTVAVLCKSKLE